MANMTATTMATYLQEQWSQKALATLRSNVVLENLVDRRWEPELGVGDGDTVNIPNFSQNSAAVARSTFGTGAATTFDAVTESQTQLVVNKQASKAWQMPVEMSVQKMAVYEPLLTEGAGQALALYLDSELAADNSNGIDGFTTNVVGTDNVDFGEDELLTCQENLNGVNAPVTDRFLVISPKSHTSLMKIDSVRNSLYATAMGTVPADRAHGYLGKYLTFSVYMSNNLEAGTSGKKNGAFHMYSIALCRQKKVTFLRDIDLTAGAFIQVYAYIVFGHKMVRETFGNELDGR